MEQCDQPKSRSRATWQWRINSRDSVIADVIRNEVSNLSTTHAHREEVARQIFSAIPDVFGLRFIHLTDVTHFLSDRCRLTFAWERYEAKLASTQFFDPSHSNEIGGMSLWILQHVLGFRISVRDDADPYYELGMSIVNHCDTLLRGDFSIRSEYDVLESRILDRINDVRSLPNDHAIHLLFEARNIQWLTEIECMVAT